MEQQPEGPSSPPAAPSQGPRKKAAARPRPESASKIAPSAGAGDAEPPASASAGGGGGDEPPPAIANRTPLPSLGPLVTWLMLLAALVLALAAGFGARQAPHPDMWRSIENWDLARWDWWAYPLERNAFKRVIVRGDLAGVHALADGSQVWAVGSGGLILHSADGGVTWEQQNPVLPAPPASTQTSRGFEWLPSARAQVSAPQDKAQQSPVQQSPVQRPPPTDPKLEALRNAEQARLDAAKKAAASKAPTPPDVVASAARRPPVQRTPPASAAAAASAPASAPAPAVVRIDPLRADLKAVVFVDALRGWAAGDRGVLLATSDGGRTWSPQASGTDVALRGLKALPDGRSVWAVGDAGMALFTNDGGQSWNLRRLPIKASLFAIDVAANGTGWAVGDAGAVFTSADNGVSWQPLNSDARSRLLSVGVTPDGQRACVAGESGRIACTSDRGQSWKLSIAPRNPSVIAIGLQAEGRNGWAIGADGSRLSTGDGGQTWSPASDPAGLALDGATASAAAQHVWGVGREGMLVVTRDAAKTWTPLASGPRSFLYDIRFDAQGQRGIAAGFGGTLLLTRDGGRTWRVTPSGTDKTLYGLAFVAEKRRAWAVAENGSILASGDAGETWRAQVSGSNSFLGGIDALDDGERLWAAGQDGVLTTRDGGRTWAVQSTGRLPTRGIAFARDGQRGWALGLLPGVLLSSTDGGERWSSRGDVGTAALTSLAITPDGQHLLASAVNGMLLGSTDGGKTWAEQQSHTTLALRKVSLLADGVRAWAAGEAGQVLMTRDGGKNWSSQAAPTTGWLFGLHMLPDGKRGWLAGQWASVIGTSDGGQTWSALAEYRRYPPPWMSVALILAVATLGTAIIFGTFRRTKESEAATRAPAVLAALLSDRPLTDLHEDRLGHAAAVLALSDFMRNRDTEPKLTLAITAPWGMGKSSMMGMLRGELNKAGYRSAWFNAWHHQQEGRQLTALFNVIRKQAVPSIFSQPFAALRVRARLLWARGWAYRLGIPLLALPLIALLIADIDRGRRDGELSLGELVRWNFAHHWLKEPRIAISGHSLVKLNPFAAPVPAAAASAPTGTPLQAKVPAARNPCETGDAARKPDAALRSEVYCWLQRAVVLQADGEREACGVRQPLIRNEAAQRKHGLCIFESADQLFDIADASIPWKPAAGGAVGADPARYLLPSERQALVGAAEILEPPPMMPTIEHFVPLLALLGLLVTKGLSVYGFQLLAPLRSLLGGAAAKPEGGAEPSGTIERYRTEFCLLTEALDGRLVVFIDDLDRCDEATVNSMLEMTNYLIDHGRCFIVIGAAMEHVKRCIKPKLQLPAHELDQYQVEYLRKLVHIELPVPPPTDAALEALLNGKGTAQPPAAPGWQQRLYAQLAEAAALARPPLLVAGVLLLALWVASGVWRGVRSPQQAPHISAIPLPSAASAAVAGGSAAALPISAAAPAASEPRPVEPAASAAVGLASGSTDWSFAPAASFAAALLVFAIWLRRSGSQLERLVVALGGAVRTADSLAFMKTLSLWKPAVRLYDPTPRGLKRFVNRARLFAIHERGAHPEADTLEVHVVALTAIHHVSPSLLDEIATELRDGVAHLREWAADKREHSDKPTEVELLRCLDLHIGFWDFADLQTVDRFRQLLGQISVR